MPTDVTQIAKIIDDHINSRFTDFKKEVVSLLKNYQVGSEQIKPSAVISPKIPDDAVTPRTINIPLLFADQATIDKLLVATVGSIESGSTLIINKDRVYIETPEFGVNVSGNNGDMSLDEKGMSVNIVNSPSVKPNYTTYSTLYVNKSATDEQVATGQYFKSLSSALGALTGKHLSKYVEIVLTTDDYYEGQMIVRGITGNSSLKIIGNGSNLRGTEIQFLSCAITISVTGVNLYQRTTTTHGLYFDNCACAYVSGCILTAIDGTTSSYGAIVGQYGTHLFVQNCEMYGAWRAVLGRNCCYSTLYNNKGNATLYVGMGLMIVEGTQPCDVLTFGYTRGSGGYLIQSGTVTVDLGTATSPESEKTTGTFSITTVHTVYGSSLWPGSWKSETGYSWQGYTSGSQYQATLLWASGLSALFGKTILSAKLRIKRVSGIGVGDDVLLKGYYGDCVYNNGSGSPGNRVSMGNLGNISNGETAEFSIPTAAISYLAENPSEHCLALNPGDSSVLSGKTYSDNYAKFYGLGGSAPELIVTYQ